MEVEERKGVALPLLCIGLSAGTVALNGYLTRVIEVEASRYTYHVFREFFSLCFVAVALASTGAAVCGRRENRPWFGLFALGQWIFLWGFTMAAAAIDGTTWAALHYCTYPLFATGFSLSLTRCFAFWPADNVQWGLLTYQLLRNLAVILCMAWDSLSWNSGAAWCLLTAAGHGLQSQILRATRATDNPLTCFLLSDGANSLLWIAPGLFGVRVAGLWPAEAPNANLQETKWPLSATAWLALVACGGLGMAGMVTFAYAVKTLPAAPAAAALAPATILLSLFVDVASGTKVPDPFLYAGASIFVLCVAGEIYFDFLPKQASEEEDAGRNLLPVHRPSEASAEDKKD